MVHSTSILQPESIRMLLALSRLLHFNLWQAYLHSSKPLKRDIYICKPVLEFELEPFQCLLLLKHLYILCESSDLWHAQLDKNHRIHFGNEAFQVRPCSLYIGVEWDAKIFVWRKHKWFYQNLKSRVSRTIENHKREVPNGKKSVSTVFFHW